MSNTTEIGSGLVVVKNVTPTFKALFDPIIVSAGSARVMDKKCMEFVIYNNYDEGYLHFQEKKDIHSALVGLLHTPLDGYFSTNDLLVAIAKQNGACEENIAKLSEGIVSDDAEVLGLADLFAIIELADPEAEIQSVHLETSFFCNKPIPGEFGGDYEYYGKNYNLIEGTSISGSTAFIVDLALEKGDLHGASKSIEQRVLNLFNGVVDDNTRDLLVRKTLNRILSELDNKNEEKVETEPSWQKRMPRG